MKPTLGRIVHYVMPGGKHRPAIIVETWGNNKAEAMEMGSAINIQVFTDGSNDTNSSACPNTLWKTSVCYSSDASVSNTWHWPERE